MKKKILIFNDYYIPAKKCGGPVTSIRNAINALCEYFDFYVEAYNHDFGDKTAFPNIEDEWYDVGNARVRYHRDGELDFNYKNMESFIKDVNPSLMWFSGLLVPNKIHNAIRIGKKYNIPILISPRGEASPDRMKLKGYKKYPYALLVSVLGKYNRSKNVYFHVTSDDEIAGLKKYFFINNEKIIKVSNIGIMPNKNKRIYEKKEGELRITFISRIHEVKNLLYAIDIINMLKCKVNFDIYGPIESVDYWNKCENLIRESPSNVRINYCGEVNPGNIEDVFINYDCFLFPTKNENYGHVIAESLANGCPVVLSKGTTPWDDLDRKAGFVCNLNYKDEFVDALNYIASLGKDEYDRFMNKTSVYYNEKIKDNEAIEGHRKMFNKIISLHSVKGEYYE